MFVVRQLDSNELKEAQKLRAQVYVHEKGWLREDSLQDGLEVDNPTDEISVHAGVFTMWADLIGTIRVVLPMAPTLPIEGIFGLKKEGKSVEISRLVLESSFRGKIIPMLGLCQWAVSYVQEHQYDYLYAVLEKPLLENLQRVGFPFETLGASKWVYNSLNWPTRCKVSEVIPSLKLMDEGRKMKAAPFFENDPPDGLIWDEMLLPTRQAETEVEA